MGILLPYNKFWAHAGWISRSFFDDCIEVIDGDTTYSDIKAEIQDTVKFHGFTLAYEHIEQNKLTRLLQLVDKVVFLNTNRGAQHFSNPDYFPAYLEKLQKLREVLKQVETEMK